MRLLINALHKIGVLRCCALFMIGILIGVVVQITYYSAVNLIPEPIPIKLKDRTPLPRIPTL